MISKPITECVKVSNLLAEGHLDIQIEATSKDETGQLLTSMQNMVKKLREIVGEVRAASDNVAAGSQQLSATADSYPRVRRSRRPRPRKCQRQWNRWAPI